MPPDSQSIQQDFLFKFLQSHPAAFPLYFAGLWLIVTTVLGWLSGWFRLADHFPDQPSIPVLKVWGQSGSMGIGVSMRGILRIAVCPDGLRIGVMRLFGPFCRDFFVPWTDIDIERNVSWFQPVAKLRFGRPAVGGLTISARLADKLANAAGKSWPENGPFLSEKPGSRLRRLAIQWAAATTFAALFFSIAPRMFSHGERNIPLEVTIIFPATAFGIQTIFRYLFGRD